MRVLITGVAGFIGSHLADRLAAAGHYVVGIDDFTTGRRDNLGDWRFVEGDILHRELFYAVANRTRPELLIHCAVSYKDPDKWHRDTDVNVSGCINAALAARHHNARLIYFQTALPPISSYAISKIAGEHYIALSKVPALIFQLANIYGPRNISGPIPAFFKRLVAGETCTVVNARRDTVYIQDLVDLVEQAAGSEVTGRFDVCSGEHYPIRRYYDAVCDAMGVSAEPTEIPRAADDVAQMDLDPRPAIDTFGWRPTVELEEGIREAIGWYSEHGVGDTFTHLRLKETV